jgi:DNA-binding NarL/FixJ family response regulator
LRKYNGLIGANFGAPDDFVRDMKLQSTDIRLSHRQTKNGSAEVVLVEDHAMFREWLTHMISADHEFVVSGQADNISDALSMIKEKQPDLALVDITLKGGSSGLELIKAMKAEGIDLPVLVLSMHDEELYAERSLRVGGMGYITKHEASSTLLKAMRLVLSGQVYLGEKMTTSILGKLSGQKLPASSGLESLTGRQLEVFRLIGKGYKGREIARELRLEESTIDTYRDRIKEKLHLRTAAEVYVRAAHWLREEE